MAADPPVSGKPVFRFAPSPNGRLHLGHAFSALANEALAQRVDGRLLLRIEDIDPVRCRPDYIDGIIEDLDWLGIRFEQRFRRQSAHLADYAAALSVLRVRELVYPCFCSRQDVRAAVARRESEVGRPWPVDPDGAPLYPGCCRGLAEADASRRIGAGEPHVLRLDMARAAMLAGGDIGYEVFDADGRRRLVRAQPACWGDVVLARKDVPTSYHLAVVVDDALQGVTHVVRGTDLEAATDIHATLQRLLGLPTPLYHFHELLIDAEGRKLAKSRSSESLATLRERGVTAAMIRQRLGFG